MPAKKSKRVAAKKPKGASVKKPKPAAASKQPAKSKATTAKKTSAAAKGPSQSAPSKASAAPAAKSSGKKSSKAATKTTTRPQSKAGAKSKANAASKAAAQPRIDAPSQPVAELASTSVSRTKPIAMENVPPPGALVDVAEANRERVVAFYEAFSELDATAMANAYAPGATFSDPVFTQLSGSQIGAMWRMLCGRAKDLSIKVPVIEANENGVHAHWEATYRFGAKNRLVCNQVDTEMRIVDGRIVSHRDRFGFWKWSRQALGRSGWLLGWTPWLRNKVRRQAMAGLVSFMAGGAAGRGVGNQP